MNKLFLFLALFLLAQFSFAQGGVRFAYTAVSADIEPAFQSSTTPSGSTFMLTYIYEKPLAAGFNLRAGLGGGFAMGSWSNVLTAPGTSLTFTTSEEIRVFHAELPLSLIYLHKTGQESWFYPEIGVQMDYMLFGDSVSRGRLLGVADQSRPLKPDVNPLGVSFVAGIGYRLNIMEFGLRYIVGNTDRYIHSDRSIRFNQLSFSVGWILVAD